MGFKQAVKNSFRNAKKDMRDIRDDVRDIGRDLTLLKKNSNEWIIYLEKENRELRARIEMLESNLKLLGTSRYY